MSGEAGGKVDATDALLLSLLRQDGRRAFEEMAQIAGVSRETVRKRINRMRREGIIRRFTVETAEGAAVDAAMMRVLFLLRLQRPHCARLAAFVADWPELLGAWTLSGENDFAIMAEVAGPEELSRLHDRLQRHPLVSGITTLHVMKTWHERF